VPFVNMYNAAVMPMNVWESRDTIDMGVLDEIEDAPRKTGAKMPVAAAPRSAVADGTGYLAIVINCYGSEGSGKLVLYVSRNAVDWEIVAEETIDAGIGLADVALSQGGYAAYLIAPGGKLVEYLVTREETTTYELTQPEGILYVTAVKPAGEYIAIVCHSIRRGEWQRRRLQARPRTGEATSPGNGDRDKPGNYDDGWRGDHRHGGGRG